MNKVLLGLFFFLILFTGCNLQEKQHHYPLIENGSLDLTSWDFEKNGSVELRGEWKFMWNKDSEEFSNPEYADTHWDTFPVPCRWAEQFDDYNGFSWLRVTIKTNSSQELGLYLWGAETAYSLWVNGREMARNGSPGTTPETFIPDHVPVFFCLPDSNTLTIAWKIANYNETNRGGATHVPRIGIYREIKNGVSQNILYNSLILGIILMMGLYHVLLWFGRKQDQSSIFFAFFCFCIFIRALCTSALVTTIFLGSNVYHLKMKLEFLSVPVSAVMFVTFLSRLYPVKSNGMILRVFQGLGMMLSLFIFIFPIHIFLYSLVAIELIVLIIGCYSIFYVLLAVLRKDKDSVIVLAGLVLLFFTTVNDILYVEQISRTPFFLTQIGLVMFIFTISAVLSIRSARAYRTAEHLSLNLGKEVEEQTRIIKKQNEERTNYFINLAHETRTPLTLILNYIEKYIQRVGISKELEIIRENLSKLRNNMVNFLDYEKLERGQEYYDHDQVVNITRVLLNSIKLFKETAYKSGINLVEKTIVNEAIIQADSHAVNRIINNLLENAIKYTDRGGVITVNLTNKDEEFILSVKDTGIGIPEDQLANIFESYYQLSRKKRNNQGIGMGLNIVKKIMDDLNGKITVESEVDKGSNFKLYFQKYTGDILEDVDLQSGESQSLINYRHGKMEDDGIEEPEKYSILIVEDNPDMLAYLKEELESLYNVFTATNGRKALDKAEIMKNINLVISDVMMDEMDGFEFLEEFKKNELYKAIPVIFLTAKDTRYDKLRALTDGAVDYINKPFDIAELRAKMYSIIKLGEFQFEQSKVQLVKSIIATSYHDSVREEQFSLMYEKKCYEYNISSREKSVLLLLLEGKTNKEISEKLFISESTVKYHIKNIFAKCNVKRKIELMNIFNI